MTKKVIISALLFSFFTGCTTASKKSEKDEKNPLVKYMETITESELKTHLFTIASDEMQGRDTGSEGQKKAGRYLIEQYQKIGLSYPSGAESFYQPVPSSYMKTAWTPTLPDSENIWVYFEGGEKKDEVIVISAHYDHVGMKNNEIYNGADDNGSGTSALLEIADAFVQAKKAGHTPKRSILFLHVTGEEYGLHGSRYYAANPILPLEKTIANINIDMIGRRGDGKKSNDNYVYVIGSDRLSTDLHKLSENANEYVGLELDYTYNDLNDPNRFYYRSDHYNFARKGIPAIFYFDGVHEDYHKATDTPDKIDFPLYAKRTKLAFATAWKLANVEDRPIIDKDGK
ncbi:MAG: M28 family metallopeptidase [Flavobacteriaceae bacterium]